MSTITGTCSANPTKYSYYAVWSEGNVNVTNNTSDVTVNVYVRKIADYNSEGSSNPQSLYINGVQHTDNNYIDMNQETIPRLCVGGTTTVTHDPDGGKTITISASGTLPYGNGYGPSSGTLSSSVALTTIPRGADITSSANFTAGNSIPITFSNPANGYLRVRTYVHDGTDYEPYIKDQNLGQTSSGTLTYTTAEINKIYTQLGGVSRASLLRVYTYSDSGYSSQIGSYDDQGGTCTIPTRATCSTSANLTIGNNLAYTLSNPYSKYVRMEYWVNGNAGWVKIKDQNNGTGTGGTFTMSSTDNDNMYTIMPNVTSASSRIRVYTYAHSDYTTQIQGYYDVNGTVSVNQTTNKPTFTTYTVGNLDKNIVNTDKYTNELVTSSTSTLLGADTKMIQGYSKLRAVITSANKMVALNYATASKYRFTSGSKYQEENYSADSTVNLDIDNANVEDVTVTAYDSRSLTTAVNDTTTITNNAGYVAVSLWGLTLTRDNSVDSGTKLAFSGSYWNEYFGGGTSGVQNTITAHWRYKLTTETWGAQTWTAITLTDTSGALSYDAYIEGDLGATGFDSEKSFDIEVRIYDKLTNTISEQTLSRGIPVIDITQDGVAIGGRYDDTEGGALQVGGDVKIIAGDVKIIAGDLEIRGEDVLQTGWYPANETWTYASADDPTYTFTISGDLTGKYSAGMRIKLTQTTAKYFIITKVAYSSPNTTITIYGGIDYDLANATITSPYYSMVKAPQGFPMTPTIWRVAVADTGGNMQSSPTQHTWYNLGSLSINIPIGLWYVSYTISLAYNASSTANAISTLSTTTSTETNTYLSTYFGGNSSGVNGATVCAATVLNLSTKDTYYLLTKAGYAGTTGIYNLGSTTPNWIEATCAYL